MIEMLVLLGVLGVIDVVAFSTLPRTWSGEGLPALERAMRPLWVWGEGSLQGFLRANPLGVVASTGLWVAGFAVTLFKAAEAPILRTVFAYVMLASFVVAAVCLGLMVTVILFNAPKRVVPPSLRHQSGVIRLRWPRRSRSGGDERPRRRSD